MTRLNECLGFKRKSSRDWRSRSLLILVITKRVGNWQVATSFKSFKVLSAEAQSGFDGLPSTPAQPCDLPTCSCPIRLLTHLRQADDGRKSESDLEMESVFGRVRRAAIFDVLLSACFVVTTFAKDMDAGAVAVNCLFSGPTTSDMMPSNSEQSSLRSTYLIRFFRLGGVHSTNGTF